MTESLALIGIVCLLVFDKFRSEKRHKREMNDALSQERNIHAAQIKGLAADMREIYAVQIEELVAEIDALKK